MPEQTRSGLLPSDLTCTDSELEEEISRVLGLTKNEARIFLALIQGDSHTANELSNLTGIHRTRIYDNLRGLESKNLISVSSDEPRKYKSLAVEVGINHLLEALENEYDKRKNAMIELGFLLGKLESQRDMHLEPVYIVPLDDILLELRSLLRDAKKHVWICKRTSGGIIDWFILKDELIRLSKSKVDIRFLGDTKVEVGFPSRCSESINLSFAIIDSTAVSFFFENCPTNGGKAIVTRNNAFVEFLSSSFLEWWKKAE